MFEKIAELHSLCFPHAPWPADEFGALQKSGAEIIASEHGFIVWRAAAEQAEIITIGVHPGHRGQGIASALMGLMEREIAKKAPRASSVKVFLEVAADNRPARGLYEKHGYAKIGARPKYYAGKTDAIVMEKELFAE
jgi:ribosomal-protein-alanine N-acetyltransferase